MTLSIPFDNAYARLPAQLFSLQMPTPVSAPRLIAFNHNLAAQLGITGYDDSEELAQVFAGNETPARAKPLAQLYAGHQFGHWNPQLGDGRAVLLGDLNTDQGRFDIQLKGSGPTPYSRNGDGRAWLGPVLREYLLSEAMHALGIPTTRALAAVETGQPVQREKVLPGAVITRVAASHIRVGTFQVLAARQDIEGLRALFEHAVDRHYPTATTPLDFLKAVIAAQASLVAKWLSVGFIHGVMNTDNCAISGETIDYGPCAFMDNFHQMTVFSSIDRKGRYAYGNQPDIIVWNMAQLATSLVPLMPDADQAVTDFTAAIHAMPELIRHNWRRAFGAKLGLANPTEKDDALINGLLHMMSEQSADFTNTFRALSHGSARDQFTDQAAYISWHETWENRLNTMDNPENLMRMSNPYLIPRNHQVEAVIQAGVNADFAPFHRLHAALAAPFQGTADTSDLTAPPAENERVLATFCGT
ncbi:YdiU family protein [Cognatishimia sp. WU-CL00825]|uniref:protein adenylyltransferase SelO n=1 Tax=Cognatishimia sp. WU-CL00825 TaxID=3127658 RepID=UPI00310C062F